MSTKTPFKYFSNETNKGAALLGLGRGAIAGRVDQSVVNISGATVDRETLTIDGIVFEIVDISTDSTKDVGTEFNNTTDPVTATITAHGLSVGDYICADDEIMLVTAVADANTFTAARGQAGTTNAAHSTTTSAIEIKEATALTAGAVTVPVADVTATLTLSSLEAIVTASTEAIAKQWAFDKLSAALGLIYSTRTGARGATIAETMSNGTVQTPTYNGADPSVTVTYVESRVPTAGEVTNECLVFTLPWVPKHVVVYIKATATDVALAWDGAIKWDSKSNKVIWIDNSGSADWDADDTVVLVAYGDQVAIQSATANP